MARPGLDRLTRELILIASCVMMGHAVPRLIAHHAEAALRIGGTRQQIIDTVLQLSLYAGRPAVTDALTVLQEVFARMG